MVELFQLCSEDTISQHKILELRAEDTEHLDNCIYISITNELPQCVSNGSNRWKEGWAINMKSMLTPLVPGGRMAPYPCPGFPTLRDLPGSLSLEASAYSSWNTVLYHSLLPSPDIHTVLSSSHRWIVTDRPSANLEHRHRFMWYSCSSVITTLTYCPMWHVKIHSKTPKFGNLLISHQRYIFIFNGIDCEPPSHWLINLCLK